MISETTTPTHVLSVSEHSSSPRFSNLNVNAAAAFGTFPIETQPPLSRVGIMGVFVVGLLGLVVPHPSVNTNTVPSYPSSTSAHPILVGHGRSAPKHDG